MLIVCISLFVATGRMFGCGYSLFLSQIALITSEFKYHIPYSTLPLFHSTMLYHNITSQQQCHAVLCDVLSHLRDWNMFISLLVTQVNT